MPGKDAQFNKSLFLEYLNATLTCDLNHDNHLGSQTPNFTFVIKCDSRHNLGLLENDRTVLEL